MLSGIFIKTFKSARVDYVAFAGVVILVIEFFRSGEGVLRQFYMRDKNR